MTAQSVKFRCLSRIELTNRDPDRCEVFHRVTLAPIRLDDGEVEAGECWMIVTKQRASDVFREGKTYVVTFRETAE